MMLMGRPSDEDPDRRASAVRRSLAVSISTPRSRSHSSRSVGVMLSGSLSAMVLPLLIIGWIVGGGRREERGKKEDGLAGNIVIVIKPTNSLTIKSIEIHAHYTPMHNTLLLACTFLNICTQHCSSRSAILTLTIKHVIRR